MISNQTAPITDPLILPPSVAMSMATLGGVGFGGFPPADAAGPPIIPNPFMTPAQATAPSLNSVLPPVILPACIPMPPHPTASTGPILNP